MEYLLRGVLGDTVGVHRKLNLLAGGVVARARLQRDFSEELLRRRVISIQVSKMYVFLRLSFEDWPAWIGHVASQGMK